jgi:hypothetical protein
LVLVQVVLVQVVRVQVVRVPALVLAPELGLELALVLAPELGLELALELAPELGLEPVIWSGVESEVFLPNSRHHSEHGIQDSWPACAHTAPL